MANLNKELIEKAKQAKSAEEILALAKGNGVSMTEEQAKAYFEQFHPVSGEISDDELENVAGGGCHAKDGRLVITCDYSCPNWEVATHVHYAGCPGLEIELPVSAPVHKCQNCKYRTIEHELWLCNNPANNK